MPSSPVPGTAPATAAPAPTPAPAPHSEAAATAAAGKPATGKAPAPAAAVKRKTARGTGKKAAPVPAAAQAAQPPAVRTKPKPARAVAAKATPAKAGPSEQQPPHAGPAAPSGAEAKAGNKVREKKAKKAKLVRDSFTIPKDEYAAIDQLKQRAIGLGVAVKKSELLRAGLQALSAQDDATLLRTIQAVPTLKTGRPGKTE